MIQNNTSGRVNSIIDINSRYRNTYGVAAPASPQVFHSVQPTVVTTSNRVSAPQAHLVGAAPITTYLPPTTSIYNGPVTTAAVSTLPVRQDSTEYTGQYGSNYSKSEGCCSKCPSWVWFVLGLLALATLCTLLTIFLTRNNSADDSASNQIAKSASSNNKSGSTPTASGVNNSCPAGSNCSKKTGTTVSTKARHHARPLF